MDAEKRKKYLKSIKENKKNCIANQELYYNGKTTSHPVFEIDLKYLVYNIHNGRFRTRYYTYKKQNNKDLDYSKESLLAVEKFLRQSSSKQNEKTKKDLIEKKQLKFGIVTLDGIIVDGNRRAILLKEIAEEKSDPNAYLKAIILDDELEENRKEILRLETNYQMGEDSKVDYNPIEKYLRCKEMEAEGFSLKDIAKHMGEKPKEIRKYKNTLELMEAYLQFSGYDGIYEMLYQKEKYFPELVGYIKQLKANGYDHTKSNWKYNKNDVIDFKNIFFHHIRGNFTLKKYGGKEYRELIKFFLNENIWKKFKDQHDENIKKIKDKLSSESIEEVNKKDILKHYKEKEEEFRKSTKNCFKNNFLHSSDRLNLKEESSKPLELLEIASMKISKVDIESDSCVTEDALQLIKGMSSKLYQYRKNIEKRLRNGKDC